MKLERLLVVIDPNRDNQPALQRAAWLARHTPTQLHLLLVDYHTGLDGRLFDSALQAKGRAALLEQHGQWLEERVAPLRSAGLQVQVDIRWGKRLDKEVLAKVAELQPDLVLKSAAHNSLLRRLLLTDSCWQLIRHCPVPLWLVHHAEWQGRSLCAALDPLHSADKPAALDHLLIRTAMELSQRFGLHAHYLHCHAPLPRTLVFDAAMVADYDSYVRDSAQAHRKAFEQLIGQYPIPLPDTHLLQGFTEEVLPRFVHEHDIDLLLMGAVARGQLDTALIGHTAQRILQAVDCDLLVFRADSSRSATQR